MLLMNGRFLSKEAFEMRRQFFVNEDTPEEGFLEKNKRASFTPPNPMSDPAQVRLSLFLFIYLFYFLAVVVVVVVVA